MIFGFSVENGVERYRSCGVLEIFTAAPPLSLLEKTIEAVAPASACLGFCADCVAMCALRGSVIGYECFD